MNLLPVFQPSAPEGSWGVAVIASWAQRMAKKGARRGYFAAPGTGPSGERCSTCRHAVRQEMASAWWKCLRTRSLWTGGVATDICVTAPACSGWEKA